MLRYALIVLMLAVVGCKSTTDYTRFVDPFIGSDYHGHVFVGASVPFGMVQVGPTNASKGWDWVSGYHYSDSVIIGFTHSHLSGTGIGDGGDILLMPIDGAKSNQVRRYSSTFSHSNEVATPGYYSVKLDNGIDVALTASARTAFHSYVFPNGSAHSVVLDLGEGIDWDAPTDTYVKQIDSTTIEGYRHSTGWAKDHKVYFTAKFSTPIRNMALVQEFYNRPRTADSILVNKAMIDFGDTKKVDVKVGISYVSCLGALQNMEAEIPHWDFDAVRASAKEQWNNQLSKIEVASVDSAVLRTFYTAMFHTMITPVLFKDVNNEYRGADGKIYTADDFTPYSVFSLWDTYRTANPLATIIHPDKVTDYVRSFLAIYDQQGKLPVWHLWGNETNCMVGYHSAAVIADAYMKGYREFDAEHALEAMVAFARSNERGLDYVNSVGYIPCEKEGWSVAKALEYAIDDHAIAVMARQMGNTLIYEEFTKRSKYYANYFDAATGFMRGKKENGEWNEKFDPFFSLHMEDDYVEGNAWQYTWLVPHDVAGLVALFGGKDQFVAKLDSLFTVSSELNQGASVDITGMIGQYAHGNEPSHATLYLYAFVGQQYKTAQKVQQVFTQFYSDKLDGIIGNEDCGQMSAWYIMSSMGIYPVDPVAGIYVFGSPALQSATIDVGGNKKFKITAEHLSPKNIYIQSVELNGKDYKKSYINHSDITAGGTLKFIMGSTPSDFGSEPENMPQSII